MEIIGTTFDKLPRERLVIGFEGENLRATVRIDCASVFAEYPNATPSLIVKPLFADAYPVVVDRNGTDVDWLITSEILSFSGDGEIQLVFYKDQVICKSAVSKIRVSRSLQVTGDMPDPVAQWIDDANRKLAEVDAQIVELEGMVDTATDAATRAEQSASTASTKAEQAAGSAATATEKATEATNAAGTATAKAAEAALSATQASNSAMSAADSESVATAKAAEAAQSAQTAAQKAEQITEAAQIATGKAGEASASATAAQASATNAASSATAAQASQTAAKASETAAGASATQAAQSAQTASTAAQTATQKAAEATQSATDAATSATNAATSAETASTKAGEAAQSAQAVAETAEQLAESLEQIAQNTHDIADHEQYAEATYAKKTDLYKKADIIHNTASGAIASFPDGAEMPVDEVTAQINPVQDLHGYDSPWPAGGGVNLLDLSSATVNTVYGFTVTKNDNTGVVTIAGAYSGTMANASFAFLLNVPYIADTKVIAFDMNASLQEHILYQSAPIRWGNTTNGNLAIDLKGLEQGATYNFTLRPLVCSNSVTPTSWTPYSNICPISGFDGLTVTRTGKNLFGYSLPIHKGYWSSTSYVGDDSVVTLENATGWTNIRVPVPDGATITISGMQAQSGVYAAWLGSDNPADVISRVANYSMNGTKTVPNGAKYFGLCFFNLSTAYADYPNAQIELGSTATAYEPYQGETYDITFPSEAGTVYGGTLDVTTGVLTVDRAQIASYNGETLSGKWISDRDVYAAGASPTTGAQVVYELATPVTYTLTASQITTLLGQNNFWHDANGDISVGYKANTKLYIDNKIAELVARIVNS